MSRRTGVHAAVDASPNGRAPLSRERVLRCAMAVADAGGLASLTMRSLAKELGVRPMAVYHYFTNKDEILDGIVDLVFGEMELPSPEGNWRVEITRRARSARMILRDHPWATALLESRSSPGPATLRHHDAVLGTLRGAGLSVPMTGHAYALLDAYVYGFALQEKTLPFETPEQSGEAAAANLETVPPSAVQDYPYLLEVVAELAQAGYDYTAEFETGLDLLLDGVEQLRPEWAARA